MRLTPKPLHEQVVVITGASSGIGLLTARLAAQRGARVVLVARSEQALRDIADSINQEGGHAISVVADVGNEQEVEQIGRVAVERFGRVDTWINNAMVSIFGRLTEIPTREHRRLFDTNYWGVVHGSRTAVRLMSEQGGVIINVGSALADRAIPIQGAYCASKFAVKGFTEALRMEIEEQGLPIYVSLIKPSSIDTPYYSQHAKNYLPVAPKNPPPVYEPRVAAEAILYCAEHPQRDVYVGAAARWLGLMGSLFPRCTDLVMEHLMPRLQMTQQPPPPREQHNLFQPTADGMERGQHPNHVFKSSLYTYLAQRPSLTTGLVVAGAALLLSGHLLRGRG